MVCMEDNLRVPSGASYPMIARNLCRKASPKTFESIPMEDNRNYAQILKRTMDYVNTGGHNVILMPGRYNSAYFEHSYLAEQTGAHLVTGSELIVEKDHLYFIDYSGRKEPVGAVYRRISDEYLDPIAAGIFEAVKDYEYGMQFASFYMPGAFLPHVRIMKTGLEDQELACKFGLPYVVLHNPRPFDTTTLNYNWQIWETKAFSIYTTNTARLDKKSAGEAVEAILNFLSQQGIVSYHRYRGYHSRVIDSSSMIPVRTDAAGFFDSKVDVGEEVLKGQLLATIQDVYTAEIIGELHSPINGVVAFMHDEPMTYANTAVFKIIEEEPW